MSGTRPATVVNDGTDAAPLGIQNSGKSKKPKSAADRLIRYALRDAPVLFRDQQGQPHALVDKQPVVLTSQSYPWLRRLMWRHERLTARGEVLSQVSGTLAAMAGANDDVRELHTRFAWHGGATYVELSQGRVVRVDGSGWQITESAPVHFRRLVNLKPLPDPITGGNIADFAAFVRINSPATRRLLLANQITAPLCNIPRPIVMVNGPQGSAKTTAARLIKRTWDPSIPESFRMNPQDFLQKCSHCALVFLDNCSRLRDWELDHLCRLVTGEGDSKRKLYSDDEDFIYELRRLVLLTGINPPGNRPDFLDRCLVIDLDRIPDDERIGEEELWGNFNQQLPVLLGAALDLLAKAIAIRPSIRLKSLPRLADWGNWAAAVYEAAGWGAEQFFADWIANVSLQNASVVEASTLAQVVLEFVTDRDSWQGTATELLSLLTELAETLGHDPKRDRTFPNAANLLSAELRELSPILEANGIAFSRNHGKTTVIELRRTRNGIVAIVEPSSTPLRAVRPDDADDAKDGFRVADDDYIEWEDSDSIGCALHQDVGGAGLSAVPEELDCRMRNISLGVTTFTPPDPSANGGTTTDEDFWNE